MSVFFRSNTKTQTKTIEIQEGMNDSFSNVNSNNLNEGESENS
jgi:hypothetical protein